MRILRKAIVLGFAGLGVYKAWELANDNLETVRDKAQRAKSRIEPALIDAETNMKAAAHDAAATVREASLEAVESVATAAGDAVSPQGSTDNEPVRSSSSR